MWYIIDIKAVVVKLWSYSLYVLLSIALNLNQVIDKLIIKSEVNETCRRNLNLRKLGTKLN